MNQVHFKRKIRSIKNRIKRIKDMIKHCNIQIDYLNNLYTHKAINKYEFIIRRNRHIENITSLDTLRANLEQEIMDLENIIG